MLLLDNQVQAYDVGRVDGLAPSGRASPERRTRGRAVGRRPPGRAVAARRPIPHRTLDEVIAADPVGLLGPSVPTRSGPTPALPAEGPRHRRPRSACRPTRRRPGGGRVRRGGGGGRPAHRRPTAPTRTRRPSPRCWSRWSTRGRCAGSASRPRPLDLIEALGVCRRSTRSSRSSRRGGSEATEGALRWVFGLSASERRAVAAAVSARRRPGADGRARRRPPRLGGPPGRRPPRRSGLPGPAAC